MRILRRSKDGKMEFENFIASLNTDNNLNTLPGIFFKSKSYYNIILILFYV